MIMERKVGEIFEYNGEWYQCMHVPQKHSCKLCDLRGLCCDNNWVKIVTCVWRHREDNTSVIFKKLEKVGEPYKGEGKIFQPYQAYIIPVPKWDYEFFMLLHQETKIIDIEIKQNKEDMEEKKLNLKEFDLEAAKAGKPVCTRDGRKARIICFDAKCNKPIVALIYDCNKETVLQYLENGRFFVDQIDKYDLMMFPQKKEGWINIYTSYDGIETGISVYETKEIAKKGVDNSVSYLGTIKIEWEE